MPSVPLADFQDKNQALVGLERKFSVDQERRSKKKIFGRPSCAACLKDDAKKRCSRCNTIFYCSTECQAKDWSSHKSECRSLRLWLKTGHCAGCSAPGHEASSELGHCKSCSCESRRCKVPTCLTQFYKAPSTFSHRIPTLIRTPRSLSKNHCLLLRCSLSLSSLTSFHFAHMPHHPQESELKSDCEPAPPLPPPPGPPEAPPPPLPPGPPEAKLDKCGCCLTENVELHGCAESACENEVCMV
jgi:hypothetical protein